MNSYVCFYNRKRLEVKAETTLEAQRLAAKQFKARKAYEVAVVFADKPVDPASL